MSSLCEQCGKKHENYYGSQHNRCNVCCTDVGTTQLHYPGGICDSCLTVRRQAREEQRRRDARPGLVEVVYGVDSMPDPDPEARGYAYGTSITDLQVGDVVLVPGNFLHRDPQEATVIRTYSDYAGEVAWIIRRLVRREALK